LQLKKEKKEKEAKEIFQPKLSESEIIINLHDENSLLRKENFLLNSENIKHSKENEKSKIEHVEFENIIHGLYKEIFFRDQMILEKNKELKKQEELINFLYRKEEFFNEKFNVFSEEVLNLKCQIIKQNKIKDEQKRKEKEKIIKEKNLKNIEKSTNNFFKKK